MSQHKGHGGRKKVAKKTSRKKGKKKAAAKPRPAPTTAEAPEPAASESTSLFDFGELPWVKKAAEWTGGLTNNALQFALRTGALPFRLGSSLLLGKELKFMTPEQLDAMKEAGLYLRDLRETAGLTLQELAEALQIADTSLLEAVENGTATLSFDLILRISAMLARHDPLPFVIRFARTYNPLIEQLAENWGAGRLAKQVEREREFVNILRRHDRVRELDDKGFKNLLTFTEAAFDMALEFIDEHAPHRHARRPRSRPKTGNKRGG